MKNNQRIAFVLCVLAVAGLLAASSYDVKKVAVMRWEFSLRQEKGLKEEISRRCHVLTAKENTIAEKFFLDKFTPPPMGENSRTCSVHIETSQMQRFYLRSHWNFLLQIHDEKGLPVIDLATPIEFPTPLCLLPLFLFVLACLFGFRGWGLAATVIPYLFLLGGANLIHATSLTLRSTLLTLTADQTFSGLVWLILWLSLYRGRVQEKPVTRSATTPWESFGNRVSSILMGLWNPTVYTLFGRLIYPIRGGLTRLVPFLDAQCFIVCLSLYLLSMDLHNLRLSVEKSFLLPRYFTFATLLFFFITYWPGRTRRQVVIWHLPRFWQSAVFLALMLVVSWKVPAFGHLPTVVRVGMALVLSELCSPRTLSLPRTLQRFLPLGGALFLACFIGVLSYQTGMMDLAMVLLEPRVHPTVFIFFTFWAGLTLGFITGNFSATFFALITFFVKAHELPLIKAALVDGILAGSLLSPFSLYNLFPSVLFRLSIQEMIRFRFKQLAYPLLIGSTIYTVSAINAVAILQPVTFVFLCLAAAAFQLRKSAWHLGSNFLPTAGSVRR